MTNVQILNKPTFKRMRAERESVPFTFKAFLQDIISEGCSIFKLTSGTVTVSGWTRHKCDVDIDTVHIEVNGKPADIKHLLEYTGGMKKIDEAAKNYVRRNYYQQEMKAV